MRRITAAGPAHRPSARLGHDLVEGDVEAVLLEETDDPRVAGGPTLLEGVETVLERAGRVVLRLLGGDRDWRAWASLMDIARVLAEASPETAARILV